MKVVIHMLAGGLLLVAGFVAGQLCECMPSPQREPAPQYYPQSHPAPRPLPDWVRPPAAADEIHIPGGAYNIEGDPTPQQLDHMKGQVLP